jgi:GNAT superfamily N-acetyltransferase
MRTDAEIESLVRAFEDCSLPRAGWTHREHLTVALWYLRHHPREEATNRIREGIRRFNLSHGNATGYHETITLAWVAVIARFLGESEREEPLSSLVGALLKECGDKDYLLRFYSEDALLSDAARRSWVAPDLGPQGVPGGLSRRTMMSTADVSYALEPDLDAGEFIDVLVRSTLAERRPVGELETIRGMLEHADVIVTARVGGLLVGVSRAITDFSFCTYLSDLAVDAAFQRRGIGRELIRRTHEAAGPRTTLILLAAPLARAYYPHIGMAQHDSCWIIPRQA